MVKIAGLTVALSATNLKGSNQVGMTPTSMHVMTYRATNDKTPANGLLYEMSVLPQCGNSQHALSDGLPYLLADIHPYPSDLRVPDDNPPINTTRCVVVSTARTLAHLTSASTYC